MKFSYGLKMIFLVCLLAASVFFGLTLGAAQIPLRDLFAGPNAQIASLRLMRILLGVVAGCALSASGIALQAILRNSLAEPYILGTSSGAGLGAVTALLLGAGLLAVPLAAFAGALASVIAVWFIARQGSRMSAQSLILSGVIVSIALSGLIVFLISVSPNEALHGMMWWLWGSLEVYDLRLLAIVSAVTAAGVFVIYVFSQDLNAISIGEEDAKHLGIRAEDVKKALFAVTSLVTASVVSVAGIIGFVGLIVPHMMRLVVGPDHRKLIPASCVGASVFMIACDLASRTLFRPIEIPIGVITAMIGSSVFIVLLKAGQRLR
jgi:iron complex transport system permease protein